MTKLSKGNSSLLTCKRCGVDSVLFVIQWSYNLQHVGYENWDKILWNPQLTINILMFRIWRILFCNGSSSAGYVICSGWNPEIFHSNLIASLLIDGKLFLLDSRLVGGRMKFFLFHLTLYSFTHQAFICSTYHSAFHSKMCRSCIPVISVSK